MSFLDKAKDLGEKAQEMVQEHTEQVDAAIAKAGEMADKATHGRFSSQLDAVEDKAHEAVKKLDDGGPTAPSDPGA